MKLFFEEEKKEPHVSYNIKEQQVRKNKDDMVATTTKCTVHDLIRHTKA